MNRIKEIEIAGKKYPLNFSLKATEMVAKRYGGLEGMDDALTDKPLDEMMEEVSWILAVLLEQGAAYKKVIDKEEIEVFTQDELKIVLGISDFNGIKMTLFGAMTAGMEREVEVEPDPNAKTKQGK